jgi:hypothetical protein
MQEEKIFQSYYLKIFPNTVLVQLTYIHKQTPPVDRVISEHIDGPTYRWFYEQKIRNGLFLLRSLFHMCMRRLF